MLSLRNSKGIGALVLIGALGMAVAALFVLPMRSAGQSYARMAPSIGWSNPHHAYIVWGDPQTHAHEVNEISLDTGQSQILGGSKPAFCELNGLAIGPQGNLYAAGRFGHPCRAAVAIFARGAHGNVAPIAVISGKRAAVAHVTSIGFDPEGRLYLTQANEVSGPSASGDLKVFAAGARGDVAPIAIIAGSNTLFDRSPLGVAVDAKDEIFVAQGTPSGDQVLKFPAHANGNVSPIAMTVVGSGQFYEMQVSGNTVYVPDGQFRFNKPTVYELSTFDLSLIGGITSRHFTEITGDADAEGRVYVQDFKRHCMLLLCGKLLEFEPGHQNPNRVIQENPSSSGGYIVVGP